MQWNISHKGQNNAIWSNIDGPSDCLSEEIVPSEVRETQICAVTYMWNLKQMVQMNLPTK